MYTLCYISDYESAYQTDHKCVTTLPLWADLAAIAKLFPWENNSPSYPTAFFYSCKESTGSVMSYFNEYMWGLDGTMLQLHLWGMVSPPAGY